MCASMVGINNETLRKSYIFCQNKFINRVDPRCDIGDIFHAKSSLVTAEYDRLRRYGVIFPQKW